MIIQDKAAFPALMTLCLQAKGDSVMPWIRKYSVECVISLLFLGYLCFFWPGILSPDSLNQYHQVIHESFSDHHPPVMAIVWVVLNKIYPGPGLVFLLHSILFWLSVYVFGTAWRTERPSLAWGYVVIALIPSVFLFSPMVWKDVGFTFTYLLCAAILTKKTVQQQKLSWVEICSILSLLFYGTAVKFQGQYVLWLMLMWFFSVQFGFRGKIKILAATVVAALALVMTINGVNNFFVPEKQKSHAWQFVKIYDIAAVSTHTHQNLFPDFIKNQPQFDINLVYERYNPVSVDDMVFLDRPILKGKNAQEREILWDTWWSVVTNYPQYYLLHRGRVFSNYFKQAYFRYNFGESNASSYVENLLVKYKLQDNQFIKFFVPFFSENLWWFIVFSTSFFIISPLLLLYFVFGISLSRRSRLGLPLIFMMGLGLNLLAVLFFFSMAATLRYVYIVSCFIHFSHPLVYYCWRKRHEDKLLSVDSNFS